MKQHQDMTWVWIRVDSWNVRTVLCPISLVKNLLFHRTKHPTTNGAHIQQPSGRFALTHGRVILPQHIATDKTIIVEGGKIVAIADHDSVGSGVETIAVDGRYIAPGLIDIHIHGALGYTFVSEVAAQAALGRDRREACGSEAKWP